MKDYGEIPGGNKNLKPLLFPFYLRYPQKFWSRYRWWKNSKLSLILPSLNRKKRWITVIDRLGAPGDALITANVIRCIKEKYPEKTVLYISAEKFTQQYIESVKKNNRNDFIHFYQIIDVLIVDDIQLLSGKAGTQDVFFHIFNHLHQNGKQVILTSDKAPVDMMDIEQRLLSRFKWGLSAELNHPDYETRVAIIKNKLYRDGVEMPEEIIEFLANNIKTNIRELEGAIISLIAHSSFNRREITIDLAKKIVDNYVKHTKREVSIDYIQKVVSEYFQMDVDTLQSKTRKRHIVQARQLAMFFAKKFTKASLASIGSQIGQRDHATVLHACKTVDNLSSTDKQFRKYVEDLNKKLTL